MDLNLTEKEIGGEKYIFFNSCINNGELYFNEVTHQVEAHRVTIPIVRYPFVSKKLFGLIPYDKRLYDQPISSVIIVEDFEYLSIENHTDEMYTRDHVPILFGFAAKNDELYLGSGSENRGVTEWSMRIWYKKINLILTDKAVVF